MKTVHILAMLLLMAGCVSGPRNGNSMAVLVKKISTNVISVSPDDTSSQVDYEESISKGVLLKRRTERFDGLGPDQSYCS